MKNASIKSIVSKHAKTAKDKYSKNHSYSSFWMDKAWGANDKFAGLGANTKGTSDVVKAIKLAGYHRAIGNFAKILTKRDIKLVFQGNQSFTDGNTISLSADIKDANFDLHVALALHESAHCVMTDFTATQNVRYSTTRQWQYLFPLINWIEDRRIDQFVFSTSPGYRAYYHKLYDTYFVSEAVTKALKSRKFRDASDWESWEMRIINSLNPASDPNAMRGLKQVLDLIDTANIARLKTTQDVIEIAEQVYDLIIQGLAMAQIEQEEQEKDGDPQDKQADGKGGKGQGNGEKSEDDDNNDGDGDSNDGGEDGDGDESGDGSGEEGGETLEDLSNAEEREAREALSKQKQLGEGNVAERKEGTKNLQNKVNSLTKVAAEIQQVGGEDGLNAFTAVTYDLTKNGRLFMEYLGIISTTKEKTDTRAMYAHPLHEAIGTYFSAYYRDSTAKAVQQGFNQGAMLGRKLQLRNEERELVTNRLRTGGLDTKRIAHAGYGVENIFKQIHIDKFKGANLHISLDASGSMGGDKWQNAVSMTVAIAKAAKHCTNMQVQVSLRHTANDRLNSPVVITVYDSRVNPLQQLQMALTVACVNSVTPEGLCFEAQYKRNAFIASSTTCDSYLINFSDGAPGGTGNYYGDLAQKHTRKYMGLLEGQLNMKVISFFIESGYDTSRKPVVSEYFASMYGAKNSFAVTATDLMGIARAMNAKFLAPTAKM